MRDLNTPNIIFDHKLDRLTIIYDYILDHNPKPPKIAMTAI